MPIALFIDGPFAGEVQELPEASPVLRRMLTMPPPRFDEPIVTEANMHSRDVTYYKHLLYFDKDFAQVNYSIRPELSHAEIYRTLRDLIHRQHQELKRRY